MGVLDGGPHVGFSFHWFQWVSMAYLLNRNAAGSEVTLYGKKG